MRINSKFILALTVLTLLSVAAKSQQFQTKDYKKCLWMTTRFYGAQRMGKNCNNWLLQTYNAKTDPNFCNWGNIYGTPYLNGDSYIKDADGSYDLTGGWFDCGDFILFGQTFFYSEYVLLLGYSEFQKGYHDFYSQDYKEYKNANNYKYEASTSGNNIPDILDECKWATDYTMKAVRDANTFYYQKGDDSDHNLWLTSPTKSAMSKSDGGEYDGTRSILKASGNVTDMAALAGASLAVMARLYADYDQSYANSCKDKALVAYNFVKNTSNGSTGAGSFYPAKDNTIFDQTILYAELYRLTGESKYLEDMETVAAKWVNDQGQYNHNWSVSYAQTSDLAAYLVATISNKYQQQAKTAFQFLMQQYKNQASGNRFDKGDYSWGYLRYIATQAFVAGLENKLNNNSDNDKYIYATLDYIMGKNSSNFSYIVGFGDNFPHYPHHRNAYRNDCGSEQNIQPITSSYAFSELGMLVGGTNTGTYNDAVGEYWCAEGGIDYNAGLVGALGYVISKLDPVEENQEEEEEEEATISKIEMATNPTKTTYTINENIDLTGAKIKVTFSDNSTQNINVTSSMISGFNSQKVADNQKVTVTYEGKTTSFNVKIEKKAISISMKTTPKTSYFVGDNLDISNGKIYLNYNDNSQDEVAITANMVSGFNSSTEGTLTLTVTYNNFTTNYTATVSKKDTPTDPDPDPEPDPGDDNNNDSDNDNPGGSDDSDGDGDDNSNTGSSDNNDGDNNNSDGDDNGNTDVPTPVINVDIQMSNIYSYDHTIYLKNVEGVVEVFNTLGYKVFSGRDVKEIYIERPGIYIVKTIAITKKLSIR